MPWWGWALIVLGALFFWAWRWPASFTAVGNALTAGGEKAQRVGWALTALVTLPVLGLIFFGAGGAIVGLVIGALLVGGMAGSKAESG